MTKFAFTFKYLRLSHSFDLHSFKTCLNWHLSLNLQKQTEKYLQIDSLVDLVIFSRIFTNLLLDKQRMILMQVELVVQALLCSELGR